VGNQAAFQTRRGALRGQHRRQPHADSVTLALSDGLGSGVKANILATLTTQIAMRMLEGNLPLGEVVQTLSETLPVCAVRKVAYSTFAIAQFFSQGSARVFEFDSPPPILLRGRKVQPVSYEELKIDGKTIHEAVLELQEGDWVVFVSDGVLNAGIGGVYPWGGGGTRQPSSWRRTPTVICRPRSGGQGGRGGRGAVRGPPRRRREHRGHQGAPQARGQRAHRSSFRSGGRRRVGGPFHPPAGSKSGVRGHHGEDRGPAPGPGAGRGPEHHHPDVPPIARLPGVDLVTEGILTLTRLRDQLRAGTDRSAVRFQVDGASCLLRLLLAVDHVHFLWGGR